MPLRQRDRRVLRAGFQAGRKRMASKLRQARVELAEIQVELKEIQARCGRDGRAPLLRRVPRDSRQGAGLD